MEVVLAPEIVFRFGSALSITLLVVSNAADETLWEFIAEEFRPVPVEGGTFRSWPINDAPPGMLALLAELQERADRELEEHGPHKSPLREVTYGMLPVGYREKTPASVLVPGEYAVLIFAEQGNASARFSVSAV